MGDLPVYIPLNLHFFDESEKTEKATPKKKQKARSEGQVAQSQEVGTAFLFLASFFALRIFAGSILNSWMGLFNYQMGLIPELGNIFEAIFISRYVAWLFGRIILLVAPLFAVTMIIGLITNLIQVGWHPTPKPLKPKFSKLNPLKGFKRIFSMQSIVNLVKSLLKLGAICSVIYIMLGSEINKIPSLLDMELGQVVSFIGDLVINLGLAIGAMYLFIALLDYAYARYKHNKQLKMTKHEIKEEYKQTEGNPLIKGKIRQKMREVSMRRMMQEVPKADVIITNPTHYAVALKYDVLKSDAPILVAKGVDYVAKRIIEAAREYNIVIVENPPLARAIYNEVKIDQQIPEEMFIAVAEILAYVFNLRNKVS